MTRREKLWIIVSETKDKRHSLEYSSNLNSYFSSNRTKYIFWSIRSLKKIANFLEKGEIVCTVVERCSIYFFFVFICDSFQWLLFSKNNRLNERFSYQFYIVRPLQSDDIGRFRCCSNHDPNKSRFNSRNRGRHEQI